MSNSAFTPTFAQNLQDASATQSGLVNTASQNFKGLKTFLEPYLRISTDTTSGAGYTQYGQSATTTNNWHIGSEGDGTFRLWNGNWGSGIERVSISSAGRITTSDLTLTGGIRQSDRLLVTTAAASGYAFIQLGESATGSNNWHFGSEGNGQFNIYSGTWGANLGTFLRMTSSGVELRPRTDGLTGLSGNSAVMSWSTSGLTANLVSTANLNAGTRIYHLRGLRIGDSVHWAGEIRVYPTLGSGQTTVAEFDFGHSSIPAGMRSVNNYPNDAERGFGTTYGSGIAHVDGVNDAATVSVVGVGNTTIISFRFRAVAPQTTVPCRIGFSIIVPI